MPDSTGLSTWLILALVILAWPVFFVGLWSAVVVLMSRLGGWGRLGKCYRATRPAQGRRVLRGVTGMAGLSSYKRIMIVTTADEGLFIALPWIFRLGHPTLFIPWSAIRKARRTRTFLRDYIAFEIGEPRIAGMRLPSAVFDGTPVFID